MLREFKQVRQATGYFRRWFDDEYFDLIVWYAEDGEVTGFQLCYDKSGNERALTWTAQSGFRHNRVDDGETSSGAGKVKQTPVLTEGGEFPRAEVVRRFAESAAGVEARLRALVETRLMEYGSR